MSTLAAIPLNAPRLPAGGWRADALASAALPAVPTGHALLDAELPGGGWPCAALAELLLPAPSAPVWSLVLPALASQQRAGVLALVNPPHEPFVPALAAAGVRPEAVLWLASEKPEAALWLAAQALACADVTAVLAWLPCARGADLRRLHLAAVQRGDGLLFALRPAAAAASASAAPLRLQLLAGEEGAGGCADGADVGALHLRVLKRRGPTLERMLRLPVHSASLRTLLDADAAVPDAAGAAMKAKRQDAAARVLAKGAGGVVVHLPLAAWVAA